MTFFNTYVQELEHRLQTGETFSTVEDWIDTLDLEEEHKSVLWLIAWREQPTHAGRALIGL